MKQRQIIMIAGFGLLGYFVLRPQTANAAPVKSDPLTLGVGSGGGGGGAFTQLLANSLGRSDSLSNDNNAVAVADPAPSPIDPPTIKTISPASSSPKIPAPVPTFSPTSPIMGRIQTELR